MSFLEKVKNRLNSLVAFVERVLGLGVKLLIGVGVVGIALLAIILASKLEKPNITSPTVMITNLKGNSGGSGVVISKSQRQSQVLTNAHVCEILETGGIVTTTGGDSHTVSEYKVSEQHDLCLITVNADLKFVAPVARRSPKMYEEATISGHPKLLPNVVATGHFSGNKVINVLVKWRECTEEDFEDDETALACLFFDGKLPIVRSYETVLVTAMIMPGSSGSAVYNSDLEISGLVFAGSGEMSYAYIVPLEFIQNFLEKEVNTLPSLKPNYDVDVSKSNRKEKKKRSITTKSLIKKCDNTTDQRLMKMCSIIVRDLEWRTPNQ